MSEPRSSWADTASAAPVSATPETVPTGMGSASAGVLEHPWMRLALSTRGLFVVSGVVALVVLVVLWSGTRAAQSASVTTVTGAATPVGRVAGSTGASGPSGPSATDDADAEAPARAAGGLGAAATSSRGRSASAAATAAPVVVHVVGAVAQPGLYTLASGSRVAAALEAAGGTTAAADLARLNLARVLIDGEQLFVPAVGEAAVPQPLAPSVGSGGASGPGGVGGASGASVTGSSTEPVDLNTADDAALQTLPGIGPALAARITTWREAHGGFSSVRDLLEVSGIGDARFAELEPLVRV